MKKFFVKISSQVSFASLDKILIVMLAMIFLASCGAERNLRPLGDGNSAIDLSLGGPMIMKGVPVPTPYSVIGYSYGWGSRWNLNATFHPSAAVYKTFASEFGAAVELMHENGLWPELMLDMRVLVVAGAGGVVAFPIFTPVFSYEFGRWTPYLGIDSLFQFFDNSNKPFLPHLYSPFVGLRARVCSNWNLGAELKWQAINNDMHFETVKHPHPPLSTYGDLAPYIYVGYEFK